SANQKQTQVRTASMPISEPGYARVQTGQPAACRPPADESDAPLAAAPAIAVAVTAAPVARRPRDAGAPRSPSCAPASAAAATASARGRASRIADDSFADAES